jgi:hypothetical protein
MSLFEDVEKKEKKNSTQKRVMD